MILLDLMLPGISGVELTKRLREVSPNTPIVVLSARPDWAGSAQDPMVEMVRTPIDPEEVLYRISKLLRGVSQDEQKQFRLPRLVVEDLRSDNGRIDAKKISEMFDLSIPQIARIIGAGEQALYKTPDARPVQPKLMHFERIAWELIRLTGSVKGLRIWLNAPNPELENDFPIDYLKEGHLEDIAAMVEDALLGHPS